MSAIAEAMKIRYERGCRRLPPDRARPAAGRGGVSR